LMARMRIGHGVIKRFWSRCTPVRGILQLWGEPKASEYVH
jgi:hypothetical protein